MRKFVLIIVLIFLTSSIFGCVETNKSEKEVNNTTETNQVSHKNKEKEKNLPDIPEKAKQLATEEFESDVLVKDSQIKVNNDEIIIAIQVNHAMNRESAKELGENFARYLASMSAVFSDNIKNGPEKDYLGELYDYYDLQIGVGTSANNFKAHGAKIKSSSHITW